MRSGAKSCYFKQNSHRLNPNNGVTHTNTSKQNFWLNWLPLTLKLVLSHLYQDLRALRDVRETISVHFP